MAHNVKCAICGKIFNRDKIQAVKHGARRYAHITCKPDGELVPLEEKIVDEDLVKLEQYIKNLFGEDYINARTKKQIKEFHEGEYHYTYSGMLKTLIWWYDIKGNSKEKANGGIGIIPFIYGDATNYYYNLYLAKLINESKDLAQYKPKEEIIEIECPIRKGRTIKLFNLDGED